MSDPLYKEIERLEVQVHFERDRANRRGERIKAALAACKALGESGLVDSEDLDPIRKALKGEK